MITMLVGLAMTCPAAVNAAPIDDARALIGAVAAMGDSQRARQLEQVIESMPEYELEAFSNSGIRGLTDLMNQQRRAIERARDLGFQFPDYPTGSAASEVETRGPRTHDSDFPVFTDYTPDALSCPNTPDQTDLSTVIEIRRSLVAAELVYKIAKALYDDTNPACHQLVVAIGVGTNPATWGCVGLGIAETVVHVAFDVAKKALELIDFCDSEIDYARIKATYEGLEYVHDQVTIHDIETALQLDTHDLEVQALIDELIERLTRIESKADLLLKSQLEISMDRRRLRSRPSVFYEERLDEVCNLAQEAIADLPAVYLIVSRAQDFITEGQSLKASDPKAATDACIHAYRLATGRSNKLQ